MPDGLMAQLWGGSAGDIAARSTGRALEPRLRGAGRASQPLVLGRGRRRFAHLRLAVCTSAIADAIAAAGLLRRCRRLWLPALVARGSTRISLLSLSSGSGSLSDILPFRRPTR